MNSKAIKRQLLAAIAMVLVAAIALGSSTYAWFVASGTVKAEGMKVQAKSEGGLAIRWAGADSELWGTTASAKMGTATALLPASTATLAKWTYAKAEKASASKAETSSYEDITTKVFSGADGAFISNNDYVVMQPFQIRSTAGDKLAKGLYVSGVDVTRGANAGNKDLDKSIRVGVRMESENRFVGNFIYAPVEGASSSYNWVEVKGDNTRESTPVTLSTKGTSADDKSQLLAEGQTVPAGEGDAVKVQVFIWYEGEDAKLYSDNYVANDLEVTVSFSSYGFGTTV